MWQLGLVERGARPGRPGLREGRTASRALGYAQVLRFLDGDWNEAEAAAQTVAGDQAFRPPAGVLVPPRPARSRWLPGPGQDAADLALAGGAGVRVGIAARATIGSMRFAKGHGTGNDFVILPDPDGRLDLSAAAVAADL